MNAATARNSSTIANTRCRFIAGSEKPATNSAGATAAPSPIAGQARADQGERLRWRHLDPEDRDSSGEERHADQRQVVKLASADHDRRAPQR